jgi:adenosylhomocysteine nucleosidase
MATMETIGLIAAMSHESKALLRLIKEPRRIRLGPFRGVRFQIMERDCVLVTSGMGLKRAADATRALLATANPRLLISFGIAGAVNADLDIGDVVAANSSYLMENGSTGEFRPLASLSEEAREAAAQALQAVGRRLVTGSTLTTRGSQAGPEGFEGLNNPVLEMETAGIAEAAAEAGIPLLSLRSISDGPREPIPLDLEAVMDEEYNFRIGKMLKIVLRHPGILLRSRQMMQNSEKAAEHAATALMAVLRQPSAITSP